MSNHAAPDSHQSQTQNLDNRAQATEPRLLGRDVTKTIEGIVAHQMTHEEDQQTAFENLGDCGAGQFVIRLTIGKPDRRTHAEQEEREDQVGRGAAVPRRVAQRCKRRLAPATGVVYRDHTCNGQTAQDVKRKKSFELLSL